MCGSFARCSGRNEENLSASEIGRRAGVSHPRALEVLRELEAERILLAHREQGWSMFYANPKHPLGDALRSLFKAEGDVSSG
jgi:hypothetical protein